MKKYPLKLSYTAKSAIWGGDLLARQWGKIGTGDNIAETWELSVRPKEMAKILNGETLSKILVCGGYSLLLCIWFLTGGSIFMTLMLGDYKPLLVGYDSV